MPNDEPFPKETVRDLIGIARALYLAFKGMGPAYRDHMTRVTIIGTKLSRALEKASKGGPGTWNQRTAWLMAEESAQELGTLVDKYVPATVLIRAAGERLKRNPRT